MTLTCFTLDSKQSEQLTILFGLHQNSSKKSRNPLPPQTQLNGTKGPLGVKDDGSRFSGKSIALQTRFVISIAQLSI